MDMALQHRPDVATNAVEVVVHVKEDLGDVQQHQVVSALEKTDGIIAAEFCPLRNHLVLAKYNKNIFSVQDGYATDKTPQL